MPKRRIGGKVTYFPMAAWIAAGYGTPQAQQGAGQGSQTPQQQAQQPPATPPTNNSTAAQNLQKFMNMTDAEKAQAVRQADNSRAIQGYPDTAYQKFVMQQGLDEAPQMVNSDEFDSIKGIEAYRVVNGSNWNDVDNMVAGTMFDQNTWFSDSGGSAAGKGIYTSTNLREDIRDYASAGRNSAIMRFKIPTGTRALDYWQARNDLQAEINSGSQFGQALGMLPRSDAVSIYALSKGYTSLSAGMSNETYYPLLTRSGIVMDYTYHKLTAAEKRNPPSQWDKLSR